MLLYDLLLQRSIEETGRSIFEFSSFFLNFQTFDLILVLDQITREHHTLHSATLQVGENQNFVQPLSYDEQPTSGGHLADLF